MSDFDASRAGTTTSWCEGATLAQVDDVAISPGVMIGVMASPTWIDVATSLGFVTQEVQMDASNDPGRRHDRRTFGRAVAAMTAACALIDVPWWR
jgi:hypothetical protein